MICNRFWGYKDEWHLDVQTHQASDKSVLPPESESVLGLLCCFLSHPCYFYLFIFLFLFCICIVYCSVARPPWTSSLIFSSFSFVSSFHFLGDFLDFIFLPYSFKFLLCLKFISTLILSEHSLRKCIVLVLCLHFLILRIHFFFLNVFSLSSISYTFLFYFLICIVIFV